MLVSPTEEAGKVLACFSSIRLGGKSDLTTSIQIAQLALKHRKNKNGGQRIIVFVGCPVTESVEALQKLGKQLKKNNVAVDVISVGEVEQNAEKLQELINSTNTNDNWYVLLRLALIMLCIYSLHFLFSHLITVPAGVSPANALLSSPIMYSASGLHSGAGGAGGNGGDNFEMFGGIDPDMDPELAMVLRVSAEEARAAEEARLKSAQEVLFVCFHGNIAVRY